MLAFVLALSGAAHSQTIADVISTQPNMTMFSQLLKTTGLAYALTATGPYTVFGEVSFLRFVRGFGVLNCTVMCVVAHVAAPTDAGFAMMPIELQNFFMNPANSYKLMQMLGYHMALGLLYVDELIPNQEIISASGDPFFVEFLTSTWLVLCPITAIPCSQITKFALALRAGLKHMDALAISSFPGLR